MADAEFLFRLIEEGAGGGTSPGTGGGPMATPQPGTRTQAREKAEVEQGGSAKVVQESQRKTDTAKREKTKIPPTKQPPGQLAVQGRIFGEAIARRAGLGGVLQAAGTAGLPLAAAGAVAGVAFAQFKAAQAINRRQIELARRLAPFSPELQQARAREQLRTTAQNLELARRFGPQLAESERARGRLGAAATETSALVSTGPLGQEVSSILDLTARAIELNNKVIEQFNRFVPPGPATALRLLLEEAGIGVDPFKAAEGNLKIFRDFPHLEPTLAPAGANLDDARRVDAFDLLGRI